ncbi:hypothetical protein [Vibrio sp. F74]|uniref:hypothetical protein n=1 Tax=Vibrio sp. F74 TaxID=700020 RepID=UPI0035F53CD7
MQKINSESNLKVSLRLQRAYLKAREEQDLVEVDLNRARIILVDKNGKLIKELHKTEH